MATSARRRKAEPEAAPEAEQEAAQDAQESMTVMELNAEIERLTVLRDGMIGAARDDFIDRVRSEAHGLGLTLEDLMPKAQPAKVTKTTKAGNATVKYRDPETGATWSGRGRMAKRFVDLKAQGRNLDEFLVQ
jgi:DNA-binding protein H-NS